MSSPSHFCYNKLCKYHNYEFSPYRKYVLKEVTRDGFTETGTIQSRTVAIRTDEIISFCENCFDAMFNDIAFTYLIK